MLSTIYICKIILKRFRMYSLVNKKSFQKNHFMCTNKAIELLDNFYEGHKKIMALFPKKDQIKRSVIKKIKCKRYGSIGNLSKIV